ncbi:MAG: FAD-binding oxidoreductase [Balneolaceae bacterium]
MNTQTDEFDSAIIGGGIAGLSLADELISRNQTVVLIDRAQPGSGSSGAPLVLINPATGMRARMIPDAEDSFLAIRELLERVQQFSGKMIFTENGILRPALDPDLAENFSRSPSKYAWPDESWVQWIDEPDFTQKYPWFGQTFGGLVISRGITVNTPEYLTEFSRYLQSLGLATFFHQTANLTESDDTGIIRVRLSEGKTISTKRVIHATGSSFTENPKWDFLPARKTKGQLIDLTFESPLDLHESISSMGYFAFMPSTPRKLVVGSTYERGYNSLETTTEGKLKLYKKLNKTLPGIISRPHSVKQWSGERVSMKDHGPALGRHPSHKNEYLFSGLGSKGMIRGRYLAKQMADFIMTDQPLNPDTNISRFPLS